MNPFNDGWPAYEFDATSIARNKDGSSSVQLSKLGAQDTPNRLSIEFQDSYNQYQQDSLSLEDEDDVDLCGQEVAVIWDAVGISTFNQASRMLLLGLNRAISGNAFIQFQTSVKALGLLPGDLITVSYLKENLERTPFRITKITPGNSFRTATITAQFHDDEWYSDTANGNHRGPRHSIGARLRITGASGRNGSRCVWKSAARYHRSRGHGQRRLRGCRVDRFLHSAIRADWNSHSSFDWSGPRGESRQAERWQAASTTSMP